MSLTEALKHARVEVASLPPAQRLRRIARITRLFVSEVVGTVAMAPYGYRALTLYQSLPPVEAVGPGSSTHRSTQSSQCSTSMAYTAHQKVYLARDIPYGDAPRAVLDVYTCASALQGGPDGAPVMLFCHGGVWATGSKWHYAPMAHALARLGIVAVVMQYTLYPDALVPQLVDEVSQALNWVLDNARQYGGDPSKVSLVGHSAGAHMCMMALLYRARTAHAAAHGTPAAMQSEDELWGTALPHVHDARMPQRFVAITGVYDISKHYCFEEGRGVEQLSTMRPAIGGFSRFASMSPSVILGNSLQHAMADQPKRPRTNAHLCAAVDNAHRPAHLQFYDRFPLHGEAIAHRVGLQRLCSSYPETQRELNEASMAGQVDVLDFPLAAAAYLPPTVLMSSCTDMTVPWYESAEMMWRLYDCGVPVKHLVYNKVGHGDFVVNWLQSQQPSTSAHGQPPSCQGNQDPMQDEVQGLHWQLAGLPSYAIDLAAILSGRVEVEYAVSQGLQQQF